MTREELLKSKEYWIGEIQLSLFELISDYLKKNKMSRLQLAEQMGVSKGYVSQILNGDFDHRISKFVELAMFIGKVPRIDYQDIDEIIKLDEFDELHTKRYETINVNLQLSKGIGISLSSDIKNKKFIEKCNNSGFINYETSEKNKEITSVA